IRDRNVTGVQTCALPISRAGRVGARGAHGPPRGFGGRAGPRRAARRDGKRLDLPRASDRSLALGAAAADGTSAIGDAPPRETSRSEERRVGKECECEWAE